MIYWKVSRVFIIIHCKCYFNENVGFLDDFVNENYEQTQFVKLSISTRKVIDIKQYLNDTWSSWVTFGK